MNRFFTLLLAASCLTAVGQVTYPYNPDGNADGDIAVGDLQDFLGTYGNPFSPSEIMVGDSSLTYWVEQLSQTVQEQQEMIDSINQMRNFRFGPREILMIGPDDWVQVPSFDGRVGWEFNPDVDGIFTALKSGNYGGVFSIVPDEVSFDDLVNLSESDILEYTDANPTLAVRANEKVLVTGIQDVVNFPFSHTVHFLSFDGVIGDSDDVPSGPCQGEFTVNYHGYDYELVEIGEQCWFAENLKTELYRNGEVITFGDENSWPSDYQGRQVIYGQRENYNCTGWYWPSEALSFSADACDSEAVIEAFGRLYNWPVVNDSRQICPSGYTVPTDEDWFDLEIHLGLGFQVANVFGDRRFYNEGLKLKSSLGWWASDEAAGNDLVGFAAQPAGEASGNGAVSYSNAGQWGLWWTSSPNGDSGGTLMATARAVRSNFKGISRFVAPRTNGYSIRCIKD